MVRNYYNNTIHKNFSLTDVLTGAPNATQVNEYKKYLSDVPGLAIIYYNPDETQMFQFDFEGEDLLHFGKENMFETWHGFVMRKDYIYKEVITVL